VGNIAFPIWLLEQDESWVDPQGIVRPIRELNQDVCLFALDYMLANAKKLRERWSAETKQSYDEHQRARRWVLERPVSLGLMKQLSVLPLLASLHEMPADA